MKKLIALAAAVGPISLMAIGVAEVKVMSLDGFGGDVSAALSRCQTKAGAEYDPVTLKRDVVSLKESGEYQDVLATADPIDGGVSVTFKVFRKMRYQAPLVVKGNDAFSASKIADESGLKDGSLYGESDLADAAAKVRAYYLKKHYPNAKVTPMPKVMPGGVNCTVTFLVDEGEKIKIGKFTFDGAEGVDEEELRRAIGVYPWWNPVGWFADDIASPEQFAEAVKKATEKYRELGYLDAVVSGPEYVNGEDGKPDSLQFQVKEGPQYKVGSTKITGVKSYAVDKVAEKSTLPKEGDIAGSKVLDDAAHSIAVTMGSGDIGLADTDVQVKWEPREADPSVLDIEFVVKEGVPVVINQVVITGNDYTKDKVIRREIELSPGDKMLADRAERSQKKLESLDYFSRVRYRLAKTNKGKDANGAEYRDLVYQVEEKNTGSFMVGVGASSVDSVYLSAEVQQSNFDIFAPSKLFRGGGQKGRLYVAAGPRIQTYEASITEPHLFDRFLQLSVDVYRRQRWYDEYDIIRTGGGVTLDYPVKFWPTWDAFGRFGVRLSAEFIEFDDPDRGYWRYKGRTVSLAQKGGEEDKYGDAFEGVARIFWSRDTRDSNRFPSTGRFSNVFLDVGTGDNQYWRLGLRHRAYYTTWKRYNHVFMASFRAETIDGFSDDVPIYNRMFLGGPKSVRGIEYRNISPMARKIRGRDPDGDLSHSYMPWGGQTLICANFEYTIPIVKMLRLAAFSDMGAVGADEFDLDLSDTFAWTVGLGLRIDIPMFPIRLDFATPIKKPSHADEEVFSFTIGYDF